jgi:hypothetical protein
MRRLALAALILLGSGPAGAGPLDDLQPGEWYEAPGTTLRPALPDPVPPNWGGPGSIMTAWSGGAFDSARDRLLVWGGGHADYGGNEVYAFDVGTLTWARVWGPSPDIPDVGAMASVETYADGNPVSRHTYDGLAYVPTVDALFAQGGSRYSNGNGSSATWIFAFGAGAWARKADAPDTMYGAHAVFDPVTGHVFHQGQSQLSEYDPDADAYTARGSINGGWWHTNETAAIDPVRRLFVSVGRDAMLVWDLAAWQQLDVTSTGGDAVIAASAPGFVYAEADARLVAWAGGTSVYTLDPDSWVWTEHQAAATNTTSPDAPQANGTYGRFQYIASRNLFVVVNSIDSNVFFYRLSTAPPPQRDGGTDDGGTPDDAGTAADASAPDGGVPDAAPADGATGGDDLEGGCGCRSVSGQAGDFAGPLALGALGLLLLRRSRWWCVLAVALFVLASPAQSGAAVVTLDANGAVLVDGEPFLPIMSWLQCPGNIAHQKSLGINTFVGDGCGGAASDYLDACATNGAWGVLDPGDPSVKDHSALLGWIFGDEPDLESNQVEPATILTQYQAIKAEDADHPTFLTVTSGFYSEDSPPAWMGGDRGRYSAYCQATDLVGFDIYPVYGWCRPDWLYKVGAAQSELITTCGGRATYQWIEAVKTSGQWCDIAEREPDDGPTPEEIRNEVWQALVQGATAIGYFTHSWECPGYAQFCLGATQEQELTRTNAQVTALTRPLLAPAHSGGVTVVAAGGGTVDAKATVEAGKLYVFAASVERSVKQVTIDVPGMLADATVQVYDESRTITATGTSFVDSFDPLGVHIYVVEDAPAPTDAGVADADNAGFDSSTGADGPTDDGGSGANDVAGGCGCRTAPSRTTGQLSGLMLLLCAQRGRRPTTRLLKSPPLHG